ncbi:ribosomal protein S18 acetylase RimI-like enzyme [Microbacterium sp. W4I4]|uniref:GNAT family N-acetyltransferase n=1 Tax=Microbacterium sp. W4I4 TaxID=3042295 RepID=UPI00278645D4|nr:GNAT family N-acetyltransferase [Microbacterium sp. W4I4]MDQ0612422.1 ribosomal protein S18 acetylase RimI-like enzyme [Microbacterium sp. W4I4]
MSWIPVTEPARRRELLTAAVGRAHAAKASAERRELAVPETDQGEIWTTEDGATIVWAMPDEYRIVLADLLTHETDPAAVWRLLEELAGEAGWSGAWSVSAYAGQGRVAALVGAARATRVATKMRVAVAGVPAPEGIRLHPMGDADYSAFRAVADEEYAQERFDSGSEPTIEAARRVAEEQMFELLPEGPRTPGHRLWVVRDRDDRRAGMLWVHFGEGVAFIYDIAMDEDRRGQGLGTQTLRAAAEETARAGADVLALNVFGSNENARRLYTREGYRETETIWSVPIVAR